MQSDSRVGLVLGGGGARAAYQVGVLRAIADIVPDDMGNPFPIISGTSAGSINAAVLAASSMRFKEGIRRLVGVWENFEADKVYRADPWDAFSRGGRLLFAMVTGGFAQSSPRSLLDNTPLRELLERHVAFERIDQAVECGALRALCVTACSYRSGRSVSFYRGAGDLGPWQRARRLGRRAGIHIDHLMASSAIPIIFPAVEIEGEYFGDGSMRQTAPVSPVLHLGANKVLIVGVRREVPIEPEVDAGPPEYPRMGQIAGYILDTLFLNSLNADIERLQRINQTLSLLPPDARSETELRAIETLIISPSEDIAAIAEPHIDTLPASVRYLMRVLGARRGSGRRLLSYLLFERAFCRELIDLGIRDTMVQKDQLLEFLNCV